MNMTIFMIINILVGIILLVLLARFAWTMWFSTTFYPVAWTRAEREQKISPALKRLLRRYPDKTRFFAWWLQVDRLDRERILGDFAEVGVYKGDSAAVLHHMDPERRLHLFDTFEGFPRRDLKHEKGEAASYTSHHFADTGINTVLKKIGGNGNIMVHAGYFPETASEAENTLFALVNLDADLYLPTRAALDFFYERLSPGGVIFIHDHNHRWEGIRRAVDEFSFETGEVPVLLPDPDSTAVIVKRKK